MRFITPSLVLVASLLLNQVAAHDNFHGAELYDRDVAGYEEIYARDLDQHEELFARDYPPNAHDSLLARDGNQHEGLYARDYPRGLERRAPPYFPGGHQILRRQVRCPMHGPNDCQAHQHGGNSHVCHKMNKNGNMCSRICT